MTIEKERIVNVLMSNDYSKKMINRVQNKVERRKTMPRVDSEETEEEELVGHVNLPYVKGTSEILRRILQSHKIRSTFYSKDTLRKSLSHPKDPISVELQNNVVYKIPCNDCNAIYIGESKRSLKTRSKEHQYAVRAGHTDKNEIADHCWEHGHRFDFEKKSVIDRESNWHARKIKESIHSLHDRNHINSVSYKLPDIWTPALTKQ